MRKQNSHFYYQFSIDTKERRIEWFSYKKWGHMKNSWEDVSNNIVQQIGVEEWEKK